MPRRNQPLFQCYENGICQNRHPSQQNESIDVNFRGKDMHLLGQTSFGPIRIAGPGYLFSRYGADDDIASH